MSFHRYVERKETEIPLHQDAHTVDDSDQTQGRCRHTNRLGLRLRRLYIGKRGIAHI